MNRDEILNDYFEWMYDLVARNRFADGVSYRKLLARLHDTDFTWIMTRDENRADDGIDFRRRFAEMQPHEDLISAVLDDLDGPCSVLEMMVALSFRIEETIMDNTEYGDRTAQWFWGMIVSLGLGSMTDDRFDKKKVDDILKKFLQRRYRPDGHGGLFTIKSCENDLRDAEIWYQMCWYLDTIS